MSALAFLQKKVRDGKRSEVVKSLGVHHHTVNSIIAGATPITAEMEAQLTYAFPDFIGSVPDAEVVERVGEPAAGVPNFAILQAVRNTYDPATVQCIVSLIRSTGCGWFQRPFDSMIERSRNLLAKAFLASTYEWSLWLDDDMVVPSGNAGHYRRALGPNINLADEFAALSAPIALASHGKTLVSGVYFSRHGVPQITAGFAPGTSLKQRIPYRGLLPVRYCGFGCVMIHRSVYLAIMEKYPDTIPGNHNRNEGGWFNSLGGGEGEDEAFCLRANECGHPSFLDMSVIAGHIGRSVFFIPQGTIK